MRFLFAIFAAAALLLAGCVSPPEQPPAPPISGAPIGPEACTAEAKLCPDGSAVGRDASSNCEFYPCPAQTGEEVVLRSIRGDFVDPGPVSVECANRAINYPVYNKKYSSCTLVSSAVGDTLEECPDGFSPTGCSICTLMCTLRNATATVSELAGNPEKYLNKNVTVEGALRLDENMFSDGRFFLDDDGSSIMVLPWAPLSVSTCPPSVQACSPPATMSSYIGKKVRAIGTFTRYGDAKTGFYIIDVSRAEIIGMPSAGVITQELCQSARGYWNECASACRNAPPGTACTLQCVQECECGGESAYQCPKGYQCDYPGIVNNATDALGVCRLGD
jgi:hypothetical protein